jgi:signal peptidase I
MRHRHLLAEIVQIVVATAVAFYLLQAFVVHPYKVEQTSMEQSFEPGQYVMVDLLTPRITGYHRGDVIVFSPTEGWPGTGDGESSTPFIKRVIGLPGETVTLAAGVVSVDGVAIFEPYVFRDGESPFGDDGEWALGPDELLVMGDHRSNSADSRIYGAIPVSAVIGRAFVRYYPLDRMSFIAAPTYGAPNP